MQCQRKEQEDGHFEEQVEDERVLHCRINSAFPAVLCQRGKLECSITMQ